MTLPTGLQFLQFGWWVIHLVAIYLVYSYAYRKGRKDERAERDGRAARSRTTAAVDPAANVPSDIETKPERRPAPPTSAPS